MNNTDSDKKHYNKNERRKNRYRSRSRSRSDDKRRKKRRSPSKSSRSSSRSLEKFDNKLKKMRDKTFRHKQEKGNREDYSINDKKIQIKLPNKSILSNIIQDNLRNNQRLDNEELERASDKLKEVDKTGNKKATLMTSFINLKTNTKLSSKDEDEYRPYVCEYQHCGLRFSDIDELVDHLNSHIA